MKRLLILPLLLLSACATTQATPDTPLTPQSFDNFSSAKAQMNAVYANLTGIPRTDAQTAIAFCKSPDASQEPTDEQNCPQCGTSVLILLDDLDTDKASIDSAFKTIQGAVLGLEGGPGIITLATKALYSKNKVDPTAQFSAIYNRFMKNWTSVQHNCWSPAVTKELLKGINAAGMSMVPIRLPLGGLQ